MPIGLPAKELHSWFTRGVPYEQYLQNAGDRAAPWHAVSEQVSIADHELLLHSFVREMKVLVLSGVWCGDCSAQGPILEKIANASPAIELCWLDRDEAIELSNHVKINAGNRVPTVIFMAEDFEPVAVLGDRTLSRYRAIAKRQLGASCDIPGAPIPQDELQENIQDWVNEFERVQLLLRLSARLRQKHGD